MNGILSVFKMPISAGLLVMGVLIALTAPPLQADTGVGNYSHSPFQISLVPGFGTHPGGRADVDFSFNILAGKVAVVRQFEWGTLLNWETDRMNGLQIGGMVNLVQGEANGVQLAGLANVVLGDYNSVSVAGLGTYAGADATGIGMSFWGHYAGGNMTGIYLTGLANFSGGDNLGTAFSGLLNYSGGEMLGVYLTSGVNFSDQNALGIFIAGLANVCRSEATGIHLAGLLNFSGDYTGIEAAPFNYAEDVAGTQIGLVNYARTLDGIPIGLFSYVEKVPVHYDLWASETAAFSAAVHSGNGKYYNLLIFGANPYDQPFHWTVGWGFGREYPINAQSFLDFDITLQQIFCEDYRKGDVNLLSKLRALYGYRFSDRGALFAGPSLNLFISSVETASKIALWGASNPTWERGDRGYYFWPGLILGVRF